MGCGGSKTDAKEVNLNPVPNNVQIVHKEEKIIENDEDIQILKPGKTTAKNELDSFVINNPALNKTLDKHEDSLDKKPEVGPDKPKQESFVHKVGNSESFTKNDFKGTKENKPVFDNDLAKPVSQKIEFEKHPHEFDFSYIHEPSKVVNENELLTDQILKEITDIN